MTEDHQTQPRRRHRDSASFQRSMFLIVSVLVVLGGGLGLGYAWAGALVSSDITEGLKPVAVTAANSAAQDTASLDRSTLPVDVGVALVRTGAQRCAVVFKVDAEHGRDIPRLGMRDVVAVVSDGVSTRSLSEKYLGCAEGAPGLTGWVDRDGFHPGPLGQK